MHAFTDTKARSWRIELSVRAVRRIWDLLRFNLHDPAELVRICNAERYLVLPQILAVLQRDAAERSAPELAGQPLDAVAAFFDETLASDETFDSAHTAFCQELADFCRSRGRAAVAKYLDATPRLLAKETQANQALLPDPAKIEADLDAKLPPATPGDSSTSTPGNLAPSPTT